MLLPAQHVSGRNAVWLAVAVVLFGGAAGYELGRSQQRAADSYVVHGTAYVGDHQATLRAGGRNYGVVGSVAWFDRHGTYHESGWPTCLARPGTSARVAFGVAMVRAPERIEWPAVTFVDCRG
jgi:hypothetical protein